MSAFSPSPTQSNAEPRRRRIGLGLKLPILALALLALAFFAASFSNVKSTQTALIESLRQDLSAQAESKADLIRLKLTSAKQTATDLAASAEATRYDEKTILAVLENTLRRNERLFGAVLAYEPAEYQLGYYYWAPYFQRQLDGSVTFTQRGTPSYNYFAKDWYKTAKEQQSDALSAPYLDESGNTWIMTWSAPFFNKKTGKVKGVAATDMSFVEISSLVSSAKVGESGYAFLLDSRGVILGIGSAGGYYEPMEISMLALARNSSSPDWEDVVNAMLADKSGFAHAADIQGRPMFVAYTQVGMNTGWSLGLAYPEEELFARVSQSQSGQLLYGGLIAAIFSVVMYVFTLPVTRSLKQLAGFAREISQKAQNVESKLEIEPLRVRTMDEVEDVSEALNEMASSLSAAFQALEEKARERAQRVERSSVEFSTIAETARDVTIIRDLDTLLNVAANLIRERFNYYYVGVFLLDARGEYAVLRAASGMSAQRLLEQNHRLRVGQGLVGNAIRANRAQIALDTNKDAVRFQNPLLPGTRSEIALPLHSHSVIIGALDIQSELPNAFEERELKILQMLADLLAAAIENAELSSQVKRALDELNAAYRETTRQTWLSETARRDRPTYEYDGLQARPVPPRLPAALMQKLERGEPIVLKERHTETQRVVKKTLLTPIQVLNQVVGVIALEQEDPNKNWSEEEIEMARETASRAAIALENARLLEESRRRALKERAIFEASARIGSALDVENILQATAEEIARVTRGSEIIMQFTNARKK